MKNLAEFHPDSSQVGTTTTDSLRTFWRTTCWFGMMPKRGGGKITLDWWWETLTGFLLVTQTSVDLLFRHISALSRRSHILKNDFATWEMRQSKERLNYVTLPPSTCWRESRLISVLMRRWHDTETIQTLKRTKWRGHHGETVAALCWLMNMTQLNTWK